MKPYPTHIYKIDGHVHALIDSYAKVANAARKAIDESDETGDPTTADIFTAASRDPNKALWFLEAHIHEAA